MGDVDLNRCRLRQLEEVNLLEMLLCGKGEGLRFEPSDETWTLMQEASAPEPLAFAIMFCIRDEPVVLNVRLPPSYPEHCTAEISVGLSAILSRSQLNELLHAYLHSSCTPDDFAVRLMCTAKEAVSIDVRYLLFF